MKTVILRDFCNKVHIDNGKGGENQYGVHRGTEFYDKISSTHVPRHVYKIHFRNLLPTPGTKWGNS